MTDHFDAILTNIRQTIIAEQKRSGSCDAICLDMHQHRMLMIAARKQGKIGTIYYPALELNCDFHIAGCRFMGRFEDVRVYVSDELPLGVIR